MAHSGSCPFNSRIGRTMYDIANSEHADKTADRSVDPAKLNRQRELDDFATRAAQSEFGAAYAPPNRAAWRDRHARADSGRHCGSLLLKCGVSVVRVEDFFRTNKTIDLDQIEAVKDAHPLDAVVSKYAKRDKRTRQKWFCPIHEEKSGSFSITKDGGGFVCYGCGARGDVIEFIQRVERLSFVKAFEHPAGKLAATSSCRSPARPICFSRAA